MFRGRIGKNVSGRAEKWTLAVDSATRSGLGRAEKWTRVNPCPQAAKHHHAGARGTEGCDRGVVARHGGQRSRGERRHPGAHTRPFFQLNVSIFCGMCRIHVFSLTYALFVGYVEQRQSVSD